MPSILQMACTLYVVTYLKSQFFSIFLYGSDKNFTVLENSNSNTIKFSIDELNIEKVDNLYKIGVNTKSKTIEVGKPELPIYSSLFQMVPGSAYEIEYEILSSYFIENIDMKVIF